MAPLSTNAEQGQSFTAPGTLVVDLLIGWPLERIEVWVCSLDSDSRGSKRLETVTVNNQGGFGLVTVFGGPRLDAVTSITGCRGPIILKASVQL